jgi:hypothetical protein
MDIKLKQEEARRLREQRLEEEQRQTKLRLQREAEAKRREEEEELEEQRRKQAENTKAIGFACVIGIKGQAKPLSTWFEENFNLWQSPKTGWTYFFPPGKGKEPALIASAPDKIYALQRTDDSYLLMLLVAKERWPGDKLVLKGPDQFKQRAQELAKIHKLGLEFEPEPERPRPEPDPERPRPRPRGMGR